MTKFVFFILINLPLLLQAQFRQTTWAMDQEKIKSVETAELLSESDHSLKYKTSVGDWDAICTYYFDGGVYYLAAYTLDVKHKDKNRYLDDYFRIKEILAEKYGDALYKNDYHWINDKHKDNRFFYGHAVSLGHLELRNEFNAPNMRVKPLLRGEQGNIYLEIYYENPYFEKKSPDNGF